MQSCVSVSGGGKDAYLCLSSSFRCTFKKNHPVKYIEQEILSLFIVDHLEA